MTSSPSKHPQIMTCIEMTIDEFEDSMSSHIRAVQALMYTQAHLMTYTNHQKLVIILSLPFLCAVFLACMCKARYYTTAWATARPKSLQLPLPIDP